MRPSGAGSRKLPSNGQTRQTEDKAKEAYTNYGCYSLCILGDSFSEQFALVSCYKGRSLNPPVFTTVHSSTCEMVNWQWSGNCQERMTRQETLGATFL